MDVTSKFYHENAEAYFEETAHLDMAHLYREFVCLLPQQARILDAGCGSGRDSKWFLDQGFDVVSIDASPALVTLARERFRVAAHVMRFDRMGFQEEFDGIWASASLLHVPAIEFPAIASKFVRALKPGGTWYLSLKEGSFEGERAGRFFRDVTEQELIQLVTHQGSLSILKIWRTKDLRASATAVTWINCLVQRIPDTTQV